MTQQPRTGSALLYDGPFIAFIAKLLSEKPLGFPAEIPTKMYR
jgi:hypothetical protein